MIIMRSKYFFQGFLFVFGLAYPPFYNQVESKEKINSYWEKVASCIHNIFHFETFKKTK